jgi:hypothetical protein
VNGLKRLLGYQSGHGAFAAKWTNRVFTITLSIFIHTVPFVHVK